MGGGLRPASASACPHFLKEFFLEGFFFKTICFLSNLMDIIIRNLHFIVALKYIHTKHFMRLEINSFLLIQSLTRIKLPKRHLQSIKMYSNLKVIDIKLTYKIWCLNLEGKKRLS